MLITRVTAKNYKTYRELDIDLTVNDDQPIILIGGMNGGGKTTLFQAIYASLYGLEVKDAKHFRRLVSASIPYNDDVRIELGIEFKGLVLSKEYTYKIKRTYGLNDKKRPMESVTLNFHGDIFTYGTAMSPTKRAEAEAEVSKIIKSNLPKELSKYFLFDAMESGNLLKEDYLTRVIKENIENVMGFNKYIMLNEAATKLKAMYIEESLELAEERKQYKELVDHKFKNQEKIKELKEDEQVKLGYLIDHKDFYKKAKDGVNLQKEFQDQIKHIEDRINDLKAKQTAYLKSISDYSEDVELQAFVPKMISMIREELELIISTVSESDKKSRLSSAQLDYIKNQFNSFLTDNLSIVLEGNDLSEAFVEYLKAGFDEELDKNIYTFLSRDEIDTIKLMLEKTSMNSFDMLMVTKNSVENEFIELPSLRAKLIEAKSNLTDDEFSIIGTYEKNELKLKEIKENIKNLENEIKELDLKINRYDISDEQVPNPKLEMCKKLSPLFEEISNSLLKSKKSRIEQTMKEDLNMTLVAYRNKVDRVELSEDMSNLTFKVFHTAGNEIYLEELNAASKQVIVQVLLKSLHQFGDYNPPVMIDTVMGYLDEDSRAALLEHYFPKLSHQTILFSTNTEIRKEIDLEKIDPFISKKYTLIRDVDKQLTEVEEGYFID